MLGAGAGAGAAAVREHRGATLWDRMGHDGTAWHGLAHWHRMGRLVAAVVVVGGLEGSAHCAGHGCGGAKALLTVVVTRTDMESATKGGGQGRSKRLCWASALGTGRVRCC